MRLATVDVDGVRHAARDEGDHLVLLEDASVSHLLRKPDWQARAQRSGPAVDHSEAPVAPLLPAVGRIIGVGLNYRGHAAEAGLPIPDHPTLFAIWPSTLVGPTEAIELPRSSSCVDWEAELAVVIGRSVAEAPVARAASAIAGYTLFNDVSVRDWQMRSSQVMQGKNFDRTKPLGPMLVTRDELGDHPRVSLTCTVDGEVVQEDSTADLVFSPAQLVSYVSMFARLEPGDVIATGTPSGVGFTRQPPRYLRPGSVVVTAAERMGALHNPCRPAPVRRGAAALDSGAPGER